MVSLVSPCLPVASMYQKCSNYALTNLLFSLCRLVWIIDLLVTHLNPISELQHAPLPSKCYEPRTCSNSFSFQCFHLWTCSWIHQRVWGCINICRFRWYPYICTYLHIYVCSLCISKLPLFYDILDLYNYVVLILMSCV